MMIELRPGDYVATADIKNEAEYHAIAKAFMEAGCKGFPKQLDKTAVIFGWSNLFGEFGWEVNERCGSLTRQLTPAQILATPQWVPEVGESVEVKLSGDHWEPCEIAFVGGRIAVFVTDKDGEQALPFTTSRFRPLPTEEDRAVEEMVEIVTSCNEQSVEARLRHLWRKGYRKQPQPAEDMSDPANWRAGDVVECLENSGNGFSVSGVYKIKNISDSKRVIGVELDDKGSVTNGWTVDKFRFVRRP